MDKLEFKHLAPYLLYQLRVLLYESDQKVITGYRNHENNGLTINLNYNLWVGLSTFKPILKPLYRKNKKQKLLHYISDNELIQMFNYIYGSRDEIQVIKSNKRVVIFWSNDNGFETLRSGEVVIYKDGELQGTKEMFEWFYSKHYDLNRLIENDLAVNINTL